MLAALGSLLLALGLPASLLVMAAVRAARSRRSRRVGDAPHCRRCGYDLTATPPDSRCPECGRDLREPNATMTGRPSPSPAGFAVAGTLAAAAIALAAFVSPGVLREVDWQRAKPAFALRWEMAEGDVDAALELSRRLASGSLSPGQMTAAAEAALAVQGDRGVPWHRAYGDIVEGARGRGAVGDAAWGTYARQAAMPYLKSRAVVRPGDDVPLQLRLGPSRMDGYGGNLPDAAGVMTMYADSRRSPATSPWPNGEHGFAFRYHLLTYAFGDGPPSEFVDPRERLLGRARGTVRRWHDEFAWLPTGSPQQETVASHNGPIRLTVPPDTPPGPTMLRATFDFKVVQPTRTRGDEPPVPDAVVAEWREDLTLPVRVAAPGEEPVQLVADDPALRRAVEASVTRHLRAPYFPEAAGAPLRQGPTGEAGVHLYFRDPPVPVAFDVRLRLPDGTVVPAEPPPPLDAWPYAYATRLVADAKGGGGPVKFSPEAMDRVRRAGVDRVDLLLVPAPDLARYTYDIDRVYGGTIVLPDVPVLYHDD